MATVRHPLSTLRQAIGEAVGKAVVPDGGGGEMSYRHKLGALLLLTALKLVHHDHGTSPGRPAAALPDEIAARDAWTAGELRQAVTFLWKDLCQGYEPASASLPDPGAFQPDLLEGIWARLGDGRLDAHWADDCSLGYAYQLYSLPERKASQTGIQAANKELTLERVIAFTQLYTPSWVVAFLLQNALFPQWQGAGPGVEVPALMEHHRHLLLPSIECNGWLPAATIRLMDPACGAGHFLLPAFDLLLGLHLCEGWDAKEAVTSILANNLAGADVDPVSLAVTALGLTVKRLRAGVDGVVRLSGLACVASSEDLDSPSNLLGSLWTQWRQCQGNPLNRRYRVVVTNPPYIGRKLLDRRLKAALKQLYPNSHQDLCAAFIERCLDLLEPGGRLGIITQASLLSLPTYDRLRARLLDEERLISVVEAGPGVFPLQGGEKVNSALLIVERGAADAGGATEVRPKRTAVFVDLAESANKAHDLAAIARDAGRNSKRLYEVDLACLSESTGYAFRYKLPRAIARYIETMRPLSKMGKVRQGLATTDNKRFLRFWWEVERQELGGRWIPYVKGAGAQRWYGPVEHVVDWADGGAAIKEAVAAAYPYLKGKTEWVVKNEKYYFREGLTFSFVNTGRFAVRWLPPGCIFDVAGSAVFAEESDPDFLLAYLNSSFVAAAARTLNPTVNFQVGDLKRLPVPNFQAHSQDELARLSVECRRISRELLAWDETSLDTVVPEQLGRLCGGEDPGLVYNSVVGDMERRSRQLAAMEAAIDRLVLETVRRTAALYDDEFAAVERWIQGALASSVSGSGADPPCETEFAASLVYFALMQAMDSGEADAGADRLTCRSPAVNRAFPLIIPLHNDEISCRALGFPGRAAGWFAEVLDGGFRWHLLSRFGKRHAKLFHRRPRFLIAELPGLKAALVCSPQVIRRMNGCDARQDWWQPSRRRWDSALDSCAAAIEDELCQAVAMSESILSAVAAKLSAVPDWRSDQLAEEWSSYQSSRTRS